jgi:mono/diheme cytochrome c family protein
MDPRRIIRGAIIASAILVGGIAGVTGGASALERDARIKLGEIEYSASCAACHGAKGKGDGPVAEVLTQKPTDLTQISKESGGTFPTQRIQKIIDGRDMIDPHGDRRMPVWGWRYLADAIERSQQVPHDVDVQAMVLGRITALVEYLESIQAE